jgi:hypothetical protein
MPRQGSVAGGGTYTWRATEVAGDANTFTVTGEGTVGTRTVTAVETVTRRARYPYALFAADGLFLNGESAGTHPGPPGIYAETGGGQDPSRQAAIASNHNIVVANGSGGGDTQVALGPAGACSGCPNPARQADPLATPDPTVPQGSSSCPGDPPGMVDGTASPAVIPAGTYVCPGDLTLKGNVTLAASPDNPVIIYMENGDGGTGPATTLHLAGLSMTVPGEPSALFILKAGSGAVDIGDGSSPATSLSGVVYAPRATLTSSTCNMSVAGSMTLDTFACDGDTSQFTLAYDDRVAALLSNAWKPSDFHEIPTPASL